MKQSLLSILFLLMPMLASADAVEINGIYYNLVTKAKEAEVTKNPNYYSGEVDIPESVEYGGGSYSVTSIGSSAFYGCHNLTSVTIPNSVTSIGSSAFYGCHNLTSVTIPNSVTTIGSSAFYECYNLTSVHISDLSAWCNIKFESSSSNPLPYALHLFINNQEVFNLTIPNSVTSIGDYAFCGCSSLTSVTIPNSVTSIGDYAFIGCSSLTSVTIPNSVTSIGNSAFSKCGGLTSVTIPNSVTSIGNSAFSKCSGLTSLTIPNSVTSISQNAFAYCSSLTSVTIPNSVTSISYEAFLCCSGLTSITIPNSVTSIGQRAFVGCSGIASVTISNSVTSIGMAAFGSCSGLKSVTIGTGIQSIDQSAFASCPELTDVFCYAENVPYTVGDAFKDSYIDYATLHVPDASINLYKSTAPWSGFGTIVGTGGSAPVTQKCATPIIAVENGEITFSCETEGVEFVSEIEAADAKKYYDGKITLTNTYTVSVYATKDGYANSDVATMEIHPTNTGEGGSGSGETGDVNGDKKVDVSDIVKIVNIIMNGSGIPSDESVTSKISASFGGGAYSSINGVIQSGSQLMWRFSNNSTESVTLTGIQLINGATGAEGSNMLTENVEVLAGETKGYTITVGILGIQQPKVRFTYQYNNKTYTVEAVMPD